MQQARARYEGNALFQSWQAILAYNKGDYEAAAEAFLRASQYTRYANTAKRGLLQSLLSLRGPIPPRLATWPPACRKLPRKNRSCCWPALSPRCCLDEIGTPSDKPDAVQSMASALNAWEQMMLEQQPRQQASVPLTRASLLVAGRTARSPP